MISCPLGQNPVLVEECFCAEPVGRRLAGVERPTEGRIVAGPAYERRSGVCLTGLQFRVSPQSEPPAERKPVCGDASGEQKIAPANAMLSGAAFRSLSHDCVLPTCCGGTVSGWRRSEARTSADIGRSRNATFPQGTETLIPGARGAQADQSSPGILCLTACSSNSSLGCLML